MVYGKHSLSAPRVLIFWTWLLLPTHYNQSYKFGHTDFCYQRMPLMARFILHTRTKVRIWRFLSNIFSITSHNLIINAINKKVDLVFWWKELSISAISSVYFFKNLLHIYLAWCICRYIQDSIYRRYEIDKVI